MNPDELRAMILQEIDKVLQRPMILRWISPADNKLLQAIRDTAQQQPDSWIQPILTNFNKEPG